MKKKVLAISIFALVFCLGIVSVNAAGRAKNRRNSADCVLMDENTSPQSQINETATQTVLETNQQTPATQNNSTVLKTQNYQGEYCSSDCPRLHNGTCNTCDYKYSSQHHNNSTRASVRQSNNLNNQHNKGGHHNNGNHHR